MLNGDQFDLDRTVDLYADKLVGDETVQLILHLRRVAPRHRADGAAEIRLKADKVTTIAGLLGHRGSSVTARHAHVPDRALIAAADHVAGYIASALKGEKVVVAFRDATTG
jgi:hypothetical protein